MSRPPGMFRAAPSCGWTPRYPAAPQFESLFPLIDPAVDRFREEQHAFRVEAFFARWSGAPLLGNFKGEIDLREFKVTRIEIQNQQPLVLRCRVRFELARRTQESPAARIGEAEVILTEASGDFRVSGVRTTSCQRSHHSPAVVPGDHGECFCRLSFFPSPTGGRNR